VQSRATDASGGTLRKFVRARPKPHHAGQKKLAAV
jgi:hypothetical protein